MQPLLRGGAATLRRVHIEPPRGGRVAAEPSRHSGRLSLAFVRAHGETLSLSLAFGAHTKAGEATFGPETTTQATLTPAHPRLQL